MKFVQKLGKALMLPVACLPICGILMGLGYAMCPSTMQGGDVTGIVQQIGFFLVKAGGALIERKNVLRHVNGAKNRKPREIPGLPWNERDNTYPILRVIRAAAP